MTFKPENTPIGWVKCIGETISYLTNGKIYPIHANDNTEKSYTITADDNELHRYAISFFSDPVATREEFESNADKKPEPMMTFDSDAVLMPAEILGMLNAHSEAINDIHDKIYDKETSNANTN